MCVVSMIADHYQEKWQWPTIPNQTVIPLPSPVTKEEFDTLKKDVLEMKELLKKAKAYDEKNNEPDCEIADKVDFLKKVAKLVGINLDDILTKSTKERKKP